MTEALQLLLCHSENDRQRAELVRAHLAPLSRGQLLFTFSVQDCAPGQHREEAFRSAVAAADAAVLLLSADFFDPSQDWLWELVAAESADNGLGLVPVILRDCAWEGDPMLAGRQPLPEDGRPLFEGDTAREDAITKVARTTW